jgi:hypothetical protein
LAIPALWLQKNRKEGQRDIWDEKDVKTINFNVRVLKIATFSKENMQVFETLRERERVLPNLSFSVLCMYA